MASTSSAPAARSPKQQMLDLVRSDGGFDGLLNGDDQITAKVIDAALPRLNVIAKYGIGLDSIDVKYATSKRIPVLFTPGVNETTVAEHTFGLMIAVAKNFWFHMRAREGRASGSARPAPSCSARRSASSAWAASARKSSSGPAASA